MTPGHRGRGVRYSRLRGLSEVALGLLMRGGWAPRALRRAGLQPAVMIVRHRVTCARWPAGVRPLTIGFVSDLHAGPTTDPRLHAEAARALRDASVDVLLLGGDFVYLDARHVDALVPILRDIPAPLGRFAVMGNHDLWADDRHLARALEGAGIRVLVNESAELPAPFEHVSIHGLDDPWVGAADAAAAFRGARDVRVLLMHAPEGILFVRDTPFDVALAGHTHGGHIALPGGIPIVVPGPLSRTYPHGRHEVGGRPLLVSRGVGATESPLRLFADPDVMVVTLG